MFLLKHRVLRQRRGFPNLDSLAFWGISDCLSAARAAPSYALIAVGAAARVSLLWVRASTCAQPLRPVMVSFTTPDHDPAWRSSVGRFGAAPRLARIFLLLMMSFADAQQCANTVIGAPGYASDCDCATEFASTEFATEDGYDFITVNGVSSHGSSLTHGPMHVQVAAETAQLVDTSSTTTFGAVQACTRGSLETLHASVHAKKGASDGLCEDGGPDFELEIDADFDSYERVMASVPELLLLLALLKPRIAELTSVINTGIVKLVGMPATAQAARALVPLDRFVDLELELSSGQMGMHAAETIEIERALKDLIRTLIAPILECLLSYVTDEVELAEIAQLDENAKIDEVDEVEIAEIAKLDEIAKIDEVDEVVIAKLDEIAKIDEVDEVELAEIAQLVDTSSTTTFGAVPACTRGSLETLKACVAAKSLSNMTSTGAKVHPTLDDIQATLMVSIISFLGGLPETDAFKAKNTIDVEEAVHETDPASMPQARSSTMGASLVAMAPAPLPGLLAMLGLLCACGERGVGGAVVSTRMLAMLGLLCAVLYGAVQAFAARGASGLASIMGPPTPEGRLAVSAAPASCRPSARRGSVGRRLCFGSAPRLVAVLFLTLMVGFAGAQTSPSPEPSPSPSLEHGQTCTETCDYASDGYCDGTDPPPSITTPDRRRCPAAAAAAWLCRHPSY